MGPVQGDSVTNTRIVPVDDASTHARVELTNIAEYIEGAARSRRDRGLSLQRPVAPRGASRRQLLDRAATTASAENVVVDLVVTSENQPAWSGP